MENILMVIPQNILKMTEKPDPAIIRTGMSIGTNVVEPYKRMK
jgi:hypothetical protein